MTAAWVTDVLIVEDDHDLRVDLAYMLQHRGFSVATAPNGTVALERIKSLGAPRVVILDLMMPEMDGWTMRQVLLQHASLKDVPVIVLSGTADLEGEAAKLNAAQWLAKPIDLDKLCAIIASHV